MSCAIEREQTSWNHVIGGGKIHTIPQQDMFAASIPLRTPPSARIRRLLSRSFLHAASSGMQWQSLGSNLRKVECGDQDNAADDVANQCRRHEIKEIRRP